ncbi:MAG: hypothetical protein ABJE10_22090 [bacterium]
MTVTHRSMVLVASFAALVATAIPAVVFAQRPQVPGPDTKRVLVTAFRGDVEGGVKAANEIRDRIKNEYNIRTLMPTSKKDIDTTLVRGGFPIDSALSPNDIKELARQVRGDEVIDGTVQKTATGYRINARMFLARDVSLSQPLIANLDTKDFGDAAKLIVDEYDRARKQLPDNQVCENFLRASNPGSAIVAARKSISTYPNATITRLCMASAFAGMKTTADSTGPWKDSVIAITRDIIKIDSASRIAFELLYDAYKAKRDSTNLAPTLIGLMHSDSLNLPLKVRVVTELVLLHRIDLALPIARQLAEGDATNLEFARQYWLVLRAAHNYKDAVKTGIEIAKMDSAFADSGYFDRQIEDLVADTAYAKAALMAEQASAKYPTNTHYVLVKAQNERRSGQLPAAKASLERALTIDPKVNGANYLLAQVSGDLGNVDDAIKFAKADVAMDPANKPRAGALLLGLGNATYKAADAAKSVEGFKKAIPILQASDEMAPSANAKFLLGVSAYQALSGSNDLLRTSHSCDDFKAANDLLTLVNINMPAGGSVDANTAKLILGGAAQYGPFIDASVKRLCK